MRQKKIVLKAGEHRFRMLLQHTNQLIAVLDAHGKILFANDRVKDIFGYDDDELKHIPILNQPEEDLINSTGANTGNQSEHGVAIRICRSLKSKEGKQVYLEGVLIWEYDKGKRVSGMAIFNDVTEKVALKATLTEAEQKFKHLFDKAPIPMYTFDPDTYKFLQVNDAALQQYGYTKSEFLELILFNIRPRTEVSRTILSIDNIINRKLDYYDTYRHLKKDGTIIDVEIFATPILFDNQPAILATALDITGRKLNENKITKAIIQTQEEERYEIGGELHDNVCQILAAAKMSMNLMKADLPASLENLYGQTLGAIIQATDDIRNLSHRLAPVFFKNTSLKESFERLLNTFNLGNDYEISLYVDKVVESLPMSRELQLNLYRILQEQLRNIINHAGATQVKLEALVHKGNLNMLISDNGVGFDLQKITPGIGLANMKRRVDLFSGKLDIAAAPGEGCEIIVTIPLDNISR